MHLFWITRIITSGPFHLNFDVNGDNKCSNARRACAVIVNYFKHVQRGRRALGILQSMLKSSEAQ
uniref:Uncharacterized protein n=1 Tax=Candidatus Kentrum sp. FM TaxID=2126340 RepID=A0A450U1T0_9GAMM|nr:MAG: hypothetical protein BECKFM1743A_GA0114220_109044 [Candidatus Kentron sp. FM]VFJ76638.1 MAG: hypothetical protein BECKFM1743C_GA0114222_109394 [Candidatus Kentron sp. FM]VFK17066.1 MAG: hypothetical protein BECKFM1743B_GA0114221_104583 [Candidatus Kentron sp. FM]